MDRLLRRRARLGHARAGLTTRTFSAADVPERCAVARCLVGGRDALATLDLIVFLPLSTPDDIATEIEYPKLRHAVDGRLKRILREDNLELLERGPPIAELTGSRRERITQLMRAIAVS